MTFGKHLGRLSAASALPLALSLLSALPAQAQDAARTPGALSHAQYLGPENLDTQMSATVWLNLHNREALDTAVAHIYQEGSPAYHHWLTRSQLAAFVPTAAEVQTVKKELAARGLTVTSTDKLNTFVKVRGSVSTLQTAFATQINRYSLHGQQMSAAAGTPKWTGAAASLVGNVSLGGAKSHPDAVRPINPATHQPYPGVALSNPAGAVYASDCFLDPKTLTLKTSGGLPAATYYGNVFGANPSSTRPGNQAPCGYSALELASAYNLNYSYSHGLKGQGQTIVIVDAYGSPTIKADANKYSQMMHLPQLTSANFQIYYPEGVPTSQDPACGSWTAETSLDVELAHAAAPGANIALVVAPSCYDNDLQTSLFYALSNGLGNVISNSYSGGEVVDLAYYPQELKIWNRVSELAASLGVSVNFSTGDYGDLEAIYGVKSVAAQAASPYATGVGGTSIALYGNGNNHFKFQTGWGTNQTQVSGVGDGAPLEPPDAYGFQFGAGGCESAYYPKPSWQKNLPGSHRQTPDVSVVADPYTGAEIVFSSGGTQSVYVYGGTSLSCPYFSGIWAIANQKAGHPLGQAAPIISSLSANAVTDIKPYSSPTNAVGMVTNTNGTTHYTAKQLAAPVQTPAPFYSALWDYGQGAWVVLSFNTDSSLETRVGWDNVTGYGSPNGANFIDEASRK